MKIDDLKVGSLVAVDQAIITTFNKILTPFTFIAEIINYIHYKLVIERKRKNEKPNAIIGKSHRLFGIIFKKHIHNRSYNDNK